MTTARTTGRPLDSALFMGSDVDFRLWSQVDVQEERWRCWPWLASFNTSGYGQIKTLGRTQLAHRVMYALEHGAIPPGMCIIHWCDERSCCNPDHLRLGTPQDNVADMVRRGRSMKGKPRTQNSPEIVRELRRRHEEDGIPGIQLADEFELDTATVYNILNGRTRADVE